MEETNETNAELFEEGPLTPTRLGAAVALGDVGVFAYLGYTMFDAPAIGALAGLFVGGGVALFLPLFMWAEPNGGLETMVPAGETHPFRSFHRLAAGVALAPAGIVLFASQFVDTDPLLGVAAALAVGAALYVPLAWLLPNATL